MKHFTSFLFLTLLFSNITFAQEEEDKKAIYLSKVQTLDGAINSLYSVISGEKDVKRDWDFFKFLFKPGAKLIPSAKKDCLHVVRYMAPDDYINSSGKWLLENGFFEKEISRKVEQFGNIAQVFSSYEAFHSESDAQPFMRGINSIQLLYDNQRWWIVNVYWMQESAEHPIPEVYLKKE
jgi:uncharacterized protein YfaT (DUF1175 family)